MIVVGLPDGSKARFPDDTSPDIMESAVKKLIAKNPNIGKKKSIQAQPEISPETPVIKQGYSPLHEKISNIKHYAKESAPHIAAMLNPLTFATDLAQQTGRSVYEAPHGKKMEALWDALAQNLFGPVVPGGPPTFLPGVIAPSMRAKVPKESPVTEKTADIPRPVPSGEAVTPAEMANRTQENIIAQAESKKPTKPLDKRLKYVEMMEKDLEGAFGPGVTQLEEGGGMRFPSTYPNWFKNKGLTRDQVTGLFDKIKSGGKLTKGQNDLVNDLIGSKRKELVELGQSVRKGKNAPKPVTAMDIDKGDSVKIGGEKFTSQGMDDKGNVTLKDGRTITVDGFDQVQIDRGKIDKVKPPSTELFPSEVPIAKIPTETGFGEAGEKGTLFEEGGPHATLKAEEQAKKAQTSLLEPPLEGSAGAMKAGQVHPPSIEQLRQSIEKNAPSVTDTEKNMTLGAKLAEKGADIKDKAIRSMQKFKGATAALWESYNKKPEISDFRYLLKKWDKAEQMSGLYASRFSKEVKKKFSPLKRKAFSKYIEGQGDSSNLSDKASRTTNRKIKSTYTEAMNLTPEDKAFVDNIRQYWEEGADKAIEEGFFEQARENYVRHSYKNTETAEKVLQKVRAENNSGLQTNPSFAKKRFYVTFFEAEQAGLIPEDDIAFQLIAWDRSFNKAINDRAFVKGLFGAKAEKDGRPVIITSGYFKEVPNPNNPEAYLVNPQMRPKNTEGYEPFNDPAFRKWKWVGESESGKPIFVHGDVLVHPDYIKQFNNLFGKSALREWKPTRKVLAASREFKNTLLSASGFHQGQEGLHAIFHGVNPFNVPELEELLQNPDAIKLIESGGVVHDYEHFSSEGAVASGLVNRIPLIGPVFEQYQGYLFQDYIPRLKLKMGLAALERNKSRYLGKGKYTEGQIYEKTADQMNAAFGLQSRKLSKMLSNPTFRDVLQLTLLAPDFLISRLKFVGQALRPGGEEQAVALLKGALGMYAGARLANMILNDGDPHFDKPFDVVINGKTYGFRSIPGDIEHLINDPRSFIYYRLNPMTTKPLLEALTGRDFMGRKRDVSQKIKDFVIGGIPIPAKGFISDQEKTILEAVLNSMGVTTYKYKTEAERKANEFIAPRIPPSSNTEEAIEKRRTKNAAIEAIKKGENIQEIKEKYDLKSQEIKRLRKTAKNSTIENRISHLSADEAMQVWDVATSEEKRQMRKAMEHKIRGAKSLGPKTKRDYIAHLKAAQY